MHVLYITHTAFSAEIKPYQYHVTLPFIKITFQMFLKKLGVTTYTKKCF